MSSSEYSDYSSDFAIECPSSDDNDDEVTELKREIQRLKLIAQRQQEANYLQNHPHWRPRVNSIIFDLTACSSVLGC